jgi:hypothetical protein
MLTCLSILSGKNEALLEAASDEDLDVEELLGRQLEQELPQGKQQQLQQIQQQTERSPEKQAPGAQHKGGEGGVEKADEVRVEMADDLQKASEMPISSSSSKWGLIVDVEKGQGELEGGGHVGSGACGVEDRGLEDGVTGVDVVEAGITGAVAAVAIEGPVTGLVATRSSGKRTPTSRRSEVSATSLLGLSLSLSRRSEVSATSLPGLRQVQV